MDSYSQYIHKSRYARYIPEENRRETWEETVSRYVYFWVDKGLIDDKVALELYDAILNLEVMPSMRALMTAGEALDRDNVAGFNCSYLAIDHPRAFDEMMYILMCGTGVGYSVERQYVSKMPEVAEEFYNTDTTVIVDDSKIGWAKAYRELISLLYSGQVPMWDVSEVRPAGDPLKTFGGRASGPEPLVDLFKFTVQLFKGAKGRKLTSIECHDLCCKIAQIVVVGGVRRSALISLSNLSDDRIRRAKHGQWWIENPQRGLANNSACYTEKPDFEAFLEEWKSLYESHSGERGIFSRVASQKQAEKNGRRDSTWDFGTNPCCVPGDTTILTDRGYVPIESVVGDKVNIWNGFEFSKVEPFYTGFQDTVTVLLSDGSNLRCTPNHKFVLDDGRKKSGGRKERREFAENLNPGDKLFKFNMPVLGKVTGTVNKEAYSQGFYAGDGNTGMDWSLLYKPKYVCEDWLVGRLGDQQEAVERKYWVHGPMKEKSYVPVNESIDYKIFWLAGLLDSDGCKAEDGFQIASTNADFLENIRLMLTTMGVKAKVGLMHEAQMRKFADDQQAYSCKEVWRLCINKIDAVSLIHSGLQTLRVSLDFNIPNRDARRFVQVVQVVKDSPCDTYCFEEPKNHTGTFNGIVTGQSEIILRPNQFCNLSEIVVRPNDTMQDLNRKVRIATIIGTLQATLTDFRYLRSSWKNNTEEEALLGVSMTGILDHPILSNKQFTGTWFDHPNMSDLPTVLNRLRKVAIETNKEWASKCGIAQSAAITCVKPSGTVSQLVDSASGIHARFAPYYIRRVRADMRDPLCKVLEDAGVPHEVDHMSDTTKVFSFPKKAPESAIFASEQTALEQLELWSIYQEYWCEHKPSITVYYKDSEFLAVGNWVYNNFNSISGISFLPYSDHTYEQAPYEQITEEEYKKMLENFPTSFEWDIQEQSDTTEGSQTLACVGNSCEI